MISTFAYKYIYIYPSSSNKNHIPQILIKIRVRQKTAHTTNINLVQSILSTKHHMETKKEQTSKRAQRSFCWGKLRYRCQEQ